MEKRFPIQFGPSVPWAFIEPHNSNCEHNHSQSLERIAERGGLSPAEAWAVVNGIDVREIRLHYAEYTKGWFELAERVNREWSVNTAKLNTLEAENAELKRDNSALRLVAEKAAHELKELDNELTESIAAVSDLMDEYADLKKRLEIAKAEGAAEDREACAVMCEAIGQEEERGDNPWLGSVLGAFWKHAARNIRALIPKEATDE